MPIISFRKGKLPAYVHKLTKVLMRVIYKISEKIMRLIVTTNSRGCFLKPKYTTHICIAFTCYPNGVSNMIVQLVINI